MLITSAQINPTIGDITGNIALMLKAARKARDEHSQMVVFPELSLTAYYPCDLLDDEQFLERLRIGMRFLRMATHETPNLYWVIGTPIEQRPFNNGKLLENALLVIKDGEILLKYNKQLLPTYGIFDERRHFEPGADVSRILKIGEARVGFMICEDGWNDEEKDYPVNPFQRLADAAPDFIVSINASPSHIGKREQRHQVFGSACKRHSIPLLYVNQIGGHDQLGYDGASFAVNADGKISFEANRFKEDVKTLKFSLSGKEFTQTNDMDFPEVTQEGMNVYEFYRMQTELILKDYARRCGFKTIVVGCSGGIDSALTLALAAEAMGPENVIAITMPSRYSSEGSVSDSVTLCKNLGVKLIEHPIGEVVSTFESSFQNAFGEPLKGISAENLQARARAVILMEYSNMYGNLLLTTGNKSEVSVGYSTLGGDSTGGLGLIGDLYKTEIFGLCKHINETAGKEIIPESIITKAPSAELAPGQVDSDSLPPYEVLDEILKCLIEGSRLSAHEKANSDKVIDDLNNTKEGIRLIQKIQKMIAQSEYKRRQAAPIARVRARAFGSGRQIPIASVQY